MIFIIGGAYTGKESYAKKTYGSDAKIIRNIHIYIKDIMREGKNPYEEIERLSDQNPDAVFISNEIGCGIVPMDKFEREYREAVGRIHCLLADKSDRTIRVVCGIGTVIK